MHNWQEFIFSDQPFEQKAQKVFEYQFVNNEVYRRFCEALSYPSDRLERADGFLPPLLPVQAFKDIELSCKPGEKHELVFQSSGTGSMSRSKHLVVDSEIYRQSLLHGFRRFYDLENSVILAYMPGYSDNPDSSLIWMANELINQDETGLSRFLPLDESLDPKEIEAITKSGKHLILFGAAFGLVDLVEKSQLSLPASSYIIETGGMKTHRREMSRQEMHRKLAKGFGLAENHIHSEYGMAELLSQAYATGGKWFRTVPWMRASIHNPDNPQEELPPYHEGLIGVVDLANVHSCSFILTRDRGLADKDGRFQVLGRWNPKDLRGCNFLIEED